MKLDPGQRVNLAMARERAIRCLMSYYPDLVHASTVGSVIWPNHHMRAQGSGAAASRILNRLKQDGLTAWDLRGSDWGWRLTKKGRAKYHELESNL